MTRDLDINGIDGIDQSEEISYLITALHEISERLQDLTVGEVDTVADSEGRTFMLRHAQDNMRHIKEDRQAAILDALAPQIALLDPNGRVVSVNAAWRRFRRENALASADGGLGLNYLTACDHAGSAAQASQVAAGLRAVLTGDTKTFSIEYAYHSPTEQRWFRLTATPLSTDRQAGAVVMHTDITDRKHDEAALLRFRAAMDATADAIYLVDRDSMRFVHVNDAACGMQELSREALLAMAPSDLLRTPSSVLERVYDDLIAGGTPAPPLEILRVRKNGATAWVELRRHAMRSVDSWTIVTLVRDITERKAKDDRIRRLSRMEAMSSRINELIVRVLDRDTLFDGACRIAVEAGAFSCAWIGSIDVRSGIGGVVASHGVDTLAREAMVLATSPAATG
ncbi:MAG: PAS domain S-box protein, partial [Herminiimonas sp.]|nr:PAS domain S-box protein [Herminiimonas sp.]